MSSQRKKWNTNKTGDRYRLVADELTKLLEKYRRHNRKQQIILMLYAHHYLKRNLEELSGVCLEKIGK
jgi:tryptophan synthase alpha subunit